MDNLIGFTFFSTQKEFEEWQLRHPERKVIGVAPHMRTMAMDEGEGKYKLSADVTSQWGVFVTYSYEYGET